MKKHVYREGDRVRIVVPEFVERVGYPLSWPMLLDEMKKDPRVVQCLSILGLPSKGAAYRDFISGVCRAECRKRGFGGKERTLHRARYDFAAEQETRVYGKQTVRTGTYYPASS